MNEEQQIIEPVPTLAGYKKIPTFKLWIANQFPYIETDFDAITNYELLQAVIKYLNTIIENENNVESNVTALYNAFVNLHDYVENYFDNLDVQEEINNKLDELVADGTLESIILNYTLTPKIYNTYTDLIADKNSFVNNMKLKTLGYSSINDKCSGEYRVNNENKGVDLGTGLYLEKINNSLIHSIDEYTGSNAEEKFYNALDNIEYGTLLIGEVEINHVYNATNKDYRNIKIMGGTLDLKIDNWFNQQNSISNSVPLFDSCYIKGNNHTFFNGNYNCVGPKFNSCDLRDVCLFNGNHYIQSLYLTQTTLHLVKNLFTATKLYDFKMIGCRVESATGKLMVLTDNDSILQGVISDSLIEGRTDVILEFVSAFKLIISNNYFESNLQGVINQLGTEKACFIDIINNVIFGNLTSDYVFNFESKIAEARCKIKDNLCNLETGKLLTNLDMSRYVEPYLLQDNYNYAHPFINKGFNIYNNRYKKYSFSKESGRWDDTDNSWNYTIHSPRVEMFTWLHPFYIYFDGSFGSSPAYQGFAILRLTPRTAYNAENNVHIVCDCTIIDSCNTFNVNKQSTVTAEVSLSAIQYQSQYLDIDVKIKGFTSNRGNFRLIDPYTIFETIDGKTE